jgi:hypothetical protein
MRPTRLSAWWLVANAVGGCGSGESAAGPHPGLDAAAANETRPSDAGTAASADSSVPGDAGVPDMQGADAQGPVTEAGEAGTGLAATHPCDQGIAGDPAVVWAENFEEGSVSAVTSRYDSANNPAGMALVGDVPAKSCGKASLKLTSGVNANATDLYTRLSGKDELFVRYYAKYQAGTQWHHTGVWFGGYNPPTPYANPMAGLKPNGDDRFSVSIEPVYGVGAANPGLDTYNYWMQMHSWMDMPSGNTAYYGNSIVHKSAFVVDDGQWMCLEVHVKLNTDPASSTGAALDIWKNDLLIRHFDAQAPVGCWIKDKFCPAGADGAECTAYPNLCATPQLPLDQQWRSTTALQLNYFWPQNYITQGPDGSVQYDDMVVATSRVGCLR